MKYKLDEYTVKHPLLRPKNSSSSSTFSLINQKELLQTLDENSILYFITKKKLQLF
jgi:hypothetical protein